MDYIIANNQLILIDYLKSKEYLIKRNKALFLSSAFASDVMFKLSVYSLIPGVQIGHPYSLVYTFKDYVDYRENETVAALEKQVAVNSEIFDECQVRERKLAHYFLNPIVYKNKLSWLDKIGALLYFTCGVKCAAKFNEASHIKKFIPSNGARYPFKARISINNANRIIKLTSGVYEYEMRAHGLVSLAKNDYTIEDDTIEISYYVDVTRVIQRYQNGIAYRDLLLDYGHILANLKLCLNHYQISVEFIEYRDNNEEYLPEFTPSFIQQDLIISCQRHVKYPFAFYLM